ncbi:MAG: helix-turn-helix transcriptional regulator [Proteobacteria bacterium]|nr:helix-turn-helix transcriptional regulator [Pseudomonadota bacterium]
MVFAEPRSVTEVDAQIGEAIRLRRKGLGLRQADIAEQVGISTQQFQKYEAGDSRISASLLFRIAAVLDCAPQEFFPGRPKQKPKRASPDDVMGLQLQRAFERIRSRRERQMVLALARRFSESAPRAKR